MKEIALGLVALALLSSFALAQYTATSEANANLNGLIDQDTEANVNLDDNSNSDYTNTIVELNTNLDSSVSRISQTYVVNGFGWVVRDEEGMFARIMIAQRALARSDGEDYIMASGILQLDNGANYRLTHDSREQPNDEYSIWMSDRYVGVLDIGSRKEYGDLVKIEGTLKIEDQDNYNVEFAAQDAWIDDNADGNVIVDADLDASIRDRRGMSGWARIRSWFTNDY